MVPFRLSQSKPSCRTMVPFGLSLSKPSCEVR